MKKLAIIFTSIVLTLGLVGCGTSSSDDTDTNNDIATEGTYTLATIAPDPTELFPKMDFNEYEIVGLVDNNEVYDWHSFIVSNATYDMYEEYIDACINGAFTEVSLKDEDYFNAYTVDGVFSITVAYSQEAIEVNVMREKSEELESSQLSYEDLKAIIPDVEQMFSDVEIEVHELADAGDDYQFFIRNATYEVYEKYVEACEDGEFTNVIGTDENVFYACSSDNTCLISVTYIEGTSDTESYVYVSVANA